MAIIAQFCGMSLIVYSNDHIPEHVHVRKGNEWTFKVELGRNEDPPRILEDAYSNLVSAKWQKLALRLVEDNLDDCWATWNRFHNH